MSSVEEITQAAEQIKAEGKSKPRKGRHAVNQPMVVHWLDAIGDRNPIYTDETAARAAGHPRRGRPAGHDSGVDHGGAGGRARRR